MVVLSEVNKFTVQLDIGRYSLLIQNIAGLKKRVITISADIRKKPVNILVLMSQRNPGTIEEDNTR